MAAVLIDDKQLKRVRAIAEKQNAYVHSIQDAVKWALDQYLASASGAPGPLHNDTPPTLAPSHPVALDAARGRGGGRSRGAQSGRRFNPRRWTSTATNG